MTRLTRTDRDWVQRARDAVAGKPADYYSDDFKAYERAALLGLLVGELLAVIDRLATDDPGVDQ